MTTLKHHEMRKTLCVNCGYSRDVQTELVRPGEAPRGVLLGSIALCLNCGIASIYDEDGWRLLTIDDFISLPVVDQRELGRLRARHAEAKRRGIIGDLTKRDPRA